MRGEEKTAAAFGAPARSEIRTQYRQQAAVRGVLLGSDPEVLTARCV